MRTCAFIAVIAVTFAVGCGDNSERPDAIPDTCGNGVVGPGEQCDQGADNGATGKPCTATCQWACEADAACDDGNSCNGAETCTRHVCTPGTAPADGATCGTGKVCRANTCVNVSCGNGHKEADEECDDGNMVNGDGCDVTCKFSCVSSDTARNCRPADACAGQGTCNDATHTCAAGTPLPDNTTCAGGPNNYCKTGVCTAPMCGNTMVEPGEQCDGGEGCKANCTFLCTNDPATECAGTQPAPTACEKFACAATHACEVVPDLAVNGNACDPMNPNNYCSAGVCTAPVCGNTVVEPGEQCDGGEGCKANCTFLCTNNPATECAGTLPGPAACEKFACTATHTCEVIPDPAADGNACDLMNPNNFCSAGVCTAPVCGNGVRERGEDCDDSDPLNLDGCDSACKFEEDQRITSLQQQFASDAFCPQNALGTAITVDAQPTIQATWDFPVSTGALSLVFKFLGLRDLTGGDTPFTLGFVNASAAGRPIVDVPTCPNGICEDSPDPNLVESLATCPQDCTYDGTSDLDWWYVRDPASVDASETPLEKLPGQITGGLLTAGPGTISLKLLFALQPAQVTLFDAKVEATIAGSPVNAPTLSTTGTTPGHLASEHLSPALTSVAGSSTGAMCSNVSLASLFNTPMPSLLQTGCTDATGNIAVFTPDNHLLDAFVAGCVLFGHPGILPTQPDGSRDGSTYHFAFDPTTLAVTSCTKDGAPALLTDCVNNATYSSYFKFAADRVIIKRN